MNQLNINDVIQYVKDNIGTFHKQRIESLKGLKLDEILKKKNPYLFKAKYLLTAEEIVKKLTDAHISSSEEGIFGGWLEGLAIFINKKVYNGWKSGIKGVDLEFDKDNIRYIVNIKSGPNWGNSSQQYKLKDDFITAIKTLRTNNSGLNVIAVNGCCYGKDSRPDKGNYFKYCGQEFWHFISGNETMYKDIIESLEYKAKEKNEEFAKKYAKMINKFTKSFAVDFCDDEGEIDWDKLLEYNSGKN